MNILITGGTGYIGSHCTVEFIQSGYNPILIDNLSNSNINILDKIEKITNKKPTFYKINLLHKDKLEHVFLNHKIDGVIHFAGLKSVKESCINPLSYFENNITASINLLQLMKKYKVYNLVFSSSATIYGHTSQLPIKETCPPQPINPYGSSKYIVEQILYQTYQSQKELWNFAVLRYFNPAGAHPSGYIGESPNNIPNNLMPYILKIMKKEISHLSVFGNDYPTKDGTGVRDYIHVVDLVQAHLIVYQMLESSPSNNQNETKPYIINLGTGVGYSVLDIIHTMEEIAKQKIPYKFIQRRKGDVAENYADVSYASKLLNWKTKKNLKDICKDSWNWAQQK